MKKYIIIYIDDIIVQITPLNKDGNTFVILRKQIKGDDLKTNDIIVKFKDEDYYIKDIVASKYQIFHEEDTIN